MAYVSGSRTRIYVDSTNVGQFMNNVSVSRNADLVDTSTFGDSDREFTKTLISATATMSGFFDPATGASEPALSGLFISSSSKAVSVFWDSDAIGSPGICGSSWEGSYEDAATVDGMITMAGNLTFSGQVDRCVSLHALGAETMTGAFASVNNGASSSNGAVANLHVTAFGSGTGTVKVQHSTDNSTWVDLITFTNFTGTTSETKTVTGTVYQYVRANLTAAGTTQTFAVAFGRRP